MSLIFVLSLIELLALTGFVVAKRRSKLQIDGRIVITEEDGKLTQILVFDEADGPVILRNKQLVVFRVEGPEEVSS